MKRVLRWHLPLALTFAAAVVLSWGFVTALRGGAGEQVGGDTTTTPVQRPPRELHQILVLGDSLARGAGDETGLGIGGNLERELRGVSVVNLGVDGATTRDLAERVSRPSIQRLAGGSEAIVVSIGGNDLFREVRETGEDEVAGDPADVVDEVIDRVTEIVGTIRDVAPEARIFVVGLYDPFREPSGQTWQAVTGWNAELAIAFADDPRITVVQTSDLFVDHDRLSRDRFHPGAEAYALIAGRIVDALRSTTTHAQRNEAGPEARLE